MLGRPFLVLARAAGEGVPGPSDVAIAASHATDRSAEPAASSNISKAAN